MLDKLTKTAFLSSTTAAARLRRVAAGASLEPGAALGLEILDAAPIAHGATGVGDCVGWPSETSNPPHRLQVGSHPNVMVANGTHDPATPLVNAMSVWLQIPDARLLIAMWMGTKP